MDNFKIKDFLENFEKETSRGTCKACQKAVRWSKADLSSHKRTSCEAASDEEKRKFAKRKHVDNSINIPVDNDLSSGNAGVRGSLSAEEKKDVSSKFANLFYRTGISFRLADSDAMKDFVKSLNPDYADSIPSSKALSGSLLDQQFAKCSKVLENIMEAKENLSLISDGWTNVRGDHIVNFCIKAPNQKPFFYTSINTSGIAQNARAVADSIISVIEQLGFEKFNCVITDNAPVMRAAWKLIEEKFPHISAYGCAAHGINLLIKDVLDTTENSKTIKEADKIIKFVMNHHLVRAKYEEKRKGDKVPHTLSMAVSTRWFSRFTSANDLHASKYVLIQLVDEAGDMLEEIAPKPNSKTVVKLIRSTEFWDRLAKLVKLIEYPANVIGEFL